MARAKLTVRIARTAGVVLSLYLVGCYTLATLYLSPSRTYPTAPKGLTDGLVGKVPVWSTSGFAQHCPSATVFVFAHGYGGDRSQWSEVMAELKKAGFDSVAPAMPGQDANPDSTVGFGMKEAQTVADTVDWCKSHGAKNVVACGVSLGGSACWLATEKTRNIDFVVSEGAFARFDEAMNHQFDRILPGGRYLLRPVEWFARAKSGIDPSGIVPLRSAMRWRGRSALIIQGSNDELIEGSHAQRLAEASQAPLWIVPGASHANCFAASPKPYLQKLIKIGKSFRSTEQIQVSY